MRDGRRKAAEEWLKRDTHGDAERESSEKNDFQQTLLFGHLNHAPIAEEEEEEEKGKKNDTNDDEVGVFGVGFEGGSFPGNLAAEEAPRRLGHFAQP